MFSHKENDLVTYFDSKFSFEFDLEMKSDVENEISIFFDALLKEFCNVWENSITQIFPNPIFCAEKLIERLYVELIQNFIESFFSNAAKHSYLAFLNSFFIVHQQNLFMAQEIHRQVYFSKNNSFEESILTRYSEEIFVPYLMRIVKVEKSFLLDLYGFFQIKTTFVEPSLLSRISRIDLSGLKGCEDCKHTEPFEDVIIGLNALFDAFERITQYNLEDSGGIKKEMAAIAIDELFQKYFFEHLGKMDVVEIGFFDNIFVIMKLLEKIENLHFESKIFSFVSEKLGTFVAEKMRQEIKNWSQNLIHKVWKDGGKNEIFRKETLAFGQSIERIVGFDASFCKNTIHLFKKSLIDAILVEVKKGKYDFKLAIRLEDDLKDFASSLSLISPMLHVESFDFLPQIAQLFTVSGEQISELVTRQPFCLFSTAQLKDLLACRKDSR